MGSIQINTQNLEASITSLESLLSGEEITAALDTVISSLPTSGQGATATTVTGYEADLRALNTALLETLTLTITVLKNANEYFTMTDDELSGYLAGMGIG